MRGASDRDTARVLSDFAARLSFEGIPDQVTETVRLFIADYYGACFAGMKVNARFNQAVLDAVLGMGVKGASSVLGLEEKLPAEYAGFMNGLYAHGADLDDGNRKSMGHIGAHVMSAVFALAEELGNVAWRDVVTALTVGYEVFNRIGAMAQPGLAHRGFHSTGMAGGPACAAACGKLLGLGADGICHAIAIAALQAGGLLLIAESGQCCKPLNPANAARTGILSARLAAKGVKGPVYPLESEKGWFHAVTDEVHYEMLEGLGETFTICESYLKPYPSCRHTHCGIEAATHIRERLLKRGKTAGDIRRAVLVTYPDGIGIAGQIRVPETADEAKFSIHYSAAAALYTGNYTIGDLEQEPRPEVGMLAEKILLVPDPVMEDTARDIRGARLSVELSDGTVEEETVLLPKGEADNPMTWGDMERKLEACLEGTVCRAETLIRKLREVDMEARYEGITALL